MTQIPGSARSAPADQDSRPLTKFRGRAPTDPANIVPHPPYGLIIPLPIVVKEYHKMDKLKALGEEGG